MLAAAMVFSTAACGSGTEDSGEKGSQGESSGEEETEGEVVPSSKPAPPTTAQQLSGPVPRGFTLHRGDRWNQS